MAKYKCKLGNDRPKICRDFPQRNSDITAYKKIVDEESTCTAKIGGATCTWCGQCCRDKSFPSAKEVPEGIPETNYEDWQDPVTKACIYLELVDP
jgi:ferredoxin